VGSILDKVFKASTAKELVRKFFTDDLNYQRVKIMERIKGASSMGNTNIVLDDPYIKLNEEDYNFFEKLGYTVFREEYRTYSKLSDKQEYYYHKYGIISWED
jgi:hypothetical protein